MLGILYAYQTVGHMFWTDPKILGSLAVFLTYGFVLYQQVSGQWQAKRQAWWNVWAFVSILLNYVISRSGFSLYHWI
jgi:HemX protein